MDLDAIRVPVGGQRLKMRLTSRFSWIGILGCSGGASRTATARIKPQKQPNFGAKVLAKKNPHPGARECAALRGGPAQRIEGPEAAGEGRARRGGPFGHPGLGLGGEYHWSRCGPRRRRQTATTLQRVAQRVQSPRGMPPRPCRVLPVPVSEVDDRRPLALAPPMGQCHRRRPEVKSVLRVGGFPTRVGPPWVLTAVIAGVAEFSRFASGDGLAREEAFSRRSSSGKSAHDGDRTRQAWCLAANRPATRSVIVQGAPERALCSRGWDPSPTSAHPPS